MKKEIKEICIHSVLLFVWLGVLWYLRTQTSQNYKWWYILISINFTYLLIKVVLSFFYEENKLVNRRHTISAIIPVYNESLDTIKKSLHSLLNQSVVVNEVIFIDDGSVSSEVYDYITSYNSVDIPIYIHRFEENKGKKAAIKWGIQQAKSDLILMLDSDGELNRDAVKEMRKPFANGKTGAVCGRIMVRNQGVNFLTKMQEIIYFNAFEVGRCAQHKFHSVVVSSGALSMYRRSILSEEKLQILDKNKFFGLPCIAGDDRLLTSIVHELGYRVVYQSSAICRTEVPETLSKYFKQQVRWLKSGLLQSLYSLRHSWRKAPLMVFEILESYLWLFNLGITIYLTLTVGVVMSLPMLGSWIIYTLVVSLIGSIKFRKYGYIRYFTSAIYSLVYGFLLCIMRIYSILSIWKTGWNTR